MWTTVAKKMKGKEFQGTLQAVVIDEAHFVLHGIYLLFQKLFLMSIAVAVLWVKAKYTHFRK